MLPFWCCESHEKYFIVDWRGCFLHYDRDSKNFVGRLELSKDGSMLPVLVSRDAEFIMGFEVGEFEKIKLLNFGKYCGLYHKDTQKYLSVRQDGRVLFYKNTWERWEQFYLMPVANLVNRKSLLNNLDTKHVSIINSNRDCRNEIPKNIWMFWDGSEIPEIVKACINNVKQLNKNYKINVLNLSNVSDFIEIPFERDDRKLSPALKSDFIRLALLYKYGGVWVDASIVFRVSIDDMISKVTKVGQYDCLAFYIERGDDYHNPVLESWFLAAPQSDEFVGRWLEQMTIVVRKGVNAYLSDLKIRNDYTEIVRKIKNPEYLVVYVAHQVVLSNYPKQYNFYLWNALFSAFNYQFVLKWNREAMMNLLCCVDNAMLNDFELPLIKLTNGDRKIIDGFYKSKVFNRSSFLGKFIAANI